MWCYLLILLQLKIVKIIGQSSYLGRRNSLRIFKLYLPIDLFNRIKLMSKFYRVSISKMMTELLEIGYLEILKTNTKGE